MSQKMGFGIWVLVFSNVPTVQNFNATLTYLHKYQIQLVLLWVLLMYSGVIGNIVGFVPVDNATSDGFAAIQVLLLLPIMVIAAMSSEGYDDVIMICLVFGPSM